MNDKLKENIDVPWYSYLILILTLVILSGIFSDSKSILAAFDFNNLAGKFGGLGNIDEEYGKLAGNFRGVGGFGARDGFLLAFTVAPSIILAFGIVEICNDYKGLLAAQKLFSPILKPLLGLPGVTAIGIISSLTSSDAGAGIAKSLHDDGYIDDTQLIIFTAFQFPAPAILVNFFIFGVILSPYISGSITIALLVILGMKFFGAILCRVYLSLFRRKKGA